MNRTVLARLLAAPLDRFSSLRQRTLVLAGVVLGGIAVTWIATSRLQERNAFSKQERLRIETVARNAAILMEGDTLSGLEVTRPENEILDWKNTPVEVRELSARLRLASELNKLGTPPVAMRIKPEARATVERYPDKKHAGAVELTLGGDDKPVWGRSTDYTPAMRSAFFDAKSGTTIDRRLDTVTAFAPILDAFGETVGVARVQAPLAPPALRSNLRLAASIFLGLILVGGTLKSLDVFLRRHCAQLAGLGGDILRLRAGNLAIRVETESSFEELQELARNLEDWRLESLESSTATTPEATPALEERTPAAPAEAPVAESNPAQPAPASAARPEAQPPVAASQPGQASPARRSEKKPDVESPPPALPGLARIRSASSRVAQLFETKRNGATAKQGKAPVRIGKLQQPSGPLPIGERTTFDVADLVNQALMPFRVRATRKRLELHVLLGERVPSHLTGDRQSLLTALNNLVDNAVRFTRRGSITVRVARVLDTTSFRFEVADTGIGLPWQNQPRIDQEITRAREGDPHELVGGLPQASALLSRLGGQMGFESQPNAGSRFWFRAPCEIPAAASLPEPSKNAPLRSVSLYS